LKPRKKLNQKNNSHRRSCDEHIYPFLALNLDEKGVGILKNFDMSQWLFLCPRGSVV
jgi:hypothetical protein